MLRVCVYVYASVALLYGALALSHEFSLPRLRSSQPTLCLEQLSFLVIILVLVVLVLVVVLVVGEKVFLLHHHALFATVQHLRHALVVLVLLVALVLVLLVLLVAMDVISVVLHRVPGARTRAARRHDEPIATH
jgi:nitrogen fixation/metabolism regulation signal transduction histidine kinase